jgi:hypothetical protein
VVLQNDAAEDFMDRELPEGVGRLGLTVGSASCLEGVIKGKWLFRVEAGNCCDHALEQASVLLDSARRASFIGVMDNEPVLVWASHFLSEMAKALLDDAHMGLLNNSDPAVDWQNIGAGRDQRQVWKRHDAPCDRPLSPTGGCSGK